MHYETTAIDKGWIATKCSKSLFNKGQDLLSQVLVLQFGYKFIGQSRHGQIGHFFLEIGGKDTFTFVIRNGPDFGDREPCRKPHLSLPS